MPALAHVVATALAVCASGCVFDPNVDDKGQLIPCFSAADCPPTWQCREALSRCIQSARIDHVVPLFDGVPAISPAFAAAGRVITVSFAVTEPLAVAPFVRVVGVDGAHPMDGGEVRAPGGAPAGASAALAFTFTYTPTGDEAEGPAAVLVDLVDLGGDAGSGLLAGVVTLDFSAPAVVASSVKVTLSPPAGALGAVTTHLVSGGAVDVEFLVDDVTATATATLRSNTGPDLSTNAVAVAGADARNFHLALTGDIALVPGSYDVAVHLADDAGNAVDDVIATGLIADGLVPSPCVAVDDSGAPTCTDGDGDGFFGPSAACPTGDDCNDDDPFVYPGAVEIPGDDVDNDCAGDGDVAVDESAGVFVSPLGHAGAAGTRLDPLRDLADAVALALARPSSTSLSWVFMASGAYDEGPIDASGVHLSGGRDGTTWAPTSAPSLITRTAPCEGSPSLQVGAVPRAVMERISITAPCLDVALLTHNNVAMRDIVIESAGDGVALDTAADAFIAHCAFTDSSASDGNALFIGGSATVIASTVTAQGEAIGVDGELTLIRSRVTGPIRPFEGASVRVLGSTVAIGAGGGDFTAETYNLLLVASTVVVSDANTQLLALSSFAGAPRVTVVGSVFSGGAFGVFGNGAETFRLDHVVPGDCFISDQSCVPASDIAACSFEGCVSATNILDVDPQLDASFRPAASSPVKDAGASLSSFSTSLAVDLDGACRDTQHPDVGAYVVAR